MSRESYRSALAGLQGDVEAMGEDVLAQLDDALGAYESGDGDRAIRVIEGDAAINETYLDLEADCVELIALQQPVAGDLRLIVASFKILTDLERVADLATNLAGYARAGGGEPPFEVDAVRIGREARSMLADALAAYADEDPAACRQIGERDEELDAACRRASERVVRGVLERRGAADGWPIETDPESISRLLLTIRDVERIGDHAEYIAARTLYATESDPSMLA
jgi:phosphate transport system protein